MNYCNCPDCQTDDCPNAGRDVRYYLPLTPPDDPNVVLIAADPRTGKVKVVTRTGYRRPNICWDAMDSAFVSWEHPDKLVRIGRHQAAAVLAYARGRGADQWADCANGAVMQYHKRESHRMPDGVRWGVLSREASR